jgi:hypothetical protein
MLPHDNLLREVALELLGLTHDDLHPDQQDLASGEEYFIVQLARDFHMPPKRFMMMLSSSDYTALRAASIVEQAKAKIELAQAERKRKRQKPGKNSQG